MKTLTKILLLGLFLETMFQSANAQKGQYPDSYWKNPNAMKNKYSDDLKQKGKSAEKLMSPLLEKHTPYHAKGELNQNDYPFRIDPLILDDQAYVLDVPQGSMIIAPMENEYVGIRLVNPSGKGNQIEWYKAFQFKQLRNTKGLVTEVSIDNIFTGPTNINRELTEQDYSREYTVVWINPKTGQHYITKENISGPRIESSSIKEKKKPKKENSNSEDLSESSINPDDFIPYIHLRANNGLPSHEETLPIYWIKWDENFTQILPIKKGDKKIRLSNSAGILYPTLINLEQIAQRATQASVTNLDSTQTKENCYIIQKGDYLSKIATNKNIPIDSLIRWNNIQNPNSLNIGQELYLYNPNKKEAIKKTKPSISAKPKQDSTKINAPDNNPLKKYYVIQKNDSWEKISKNMGVPEDSLRKWYPTTRIGDTIHLKGKLSKMYYNTQSKKFIRDSLKK